MKYLYEDHTAVDGKTVTEPTTAILDEATVFEAVNEAHKNGLRIRVYSIGPCLIDWAPPVETAPEPAHKTGSNKI